MKKRALMILLSFLLVVPFISAIDVSLSRASYEPGELLQAEITGSFISFEPENILIYEQGKVHSTPVISDLTRQENRYYFYAILPHAEGNYSIKIEDTDYTQAGQIKTDTITQNFTIKRTNRSALSIVPGFVLTSEDFDITFKSLYGDLQVTASLDATGDSQTVSLVEDAEEILTFSISGISEPTFLSVTYDEDVGESEETEESGGFLSGLFGGDTEVTLSPQGYNIPIFVIGKKQTPPTEPVEKTELRFVPEALTGKVTSSHAFKILLENSGTTNITDIEIASDSNITLGETSIDLIEPSEQVILPLVIPEDLEVGEVFLGIITASFEDTQILFPFSFEITESERDIEIIIDTADETLGCDDLGGTICREGETCNLDTEPSIDGPCCTGICQEVKKSNTGIIIGILIIVVVIGIVVFFYLKGKKKLKPKSTEEILKAKEEKFGERMKGAPGEISGGLGRA